MNVFRTGLYRKQVAKLLTTDEWADIETSIILTPDRWPIIAGTDGARKARVPLAGRGKRGGGRVIYFWHSEAGDIHFLMLYAKNRQEDIGHDDKKTIRKIVALIKNKT